jgi:outer membrane protein OmpA-like peptidoglycan-associated protein
MSAVRWTIAVALAAALGGCATTPQRDLAHERLQASLTELETDPALGELAGAERLRARQAVDQLGTSDKSQRAANLYLAERRVDIARITAQAELAQRQLEQLERERDRILLEATRRDAESARIEAEKLRLQSLARAEETQRAQREAEDARRARREAELALSAAESLRIQLETMTARSEARGQVMTLSGDAFASGQADLRPEARANLQKVVEFVRGAGAKPVLIEGHTDNRGSANLNQTLSQRRAEAVRNALIEEGVAAERMTAVGLGMDRPVADNATQEGRSRNRRVEIVVQNK